MPFQHSSQLCRGNRAILAAPTSLAPTGFRLFVGFAVFIFAYLYQVWLLQAAAFDNPGFWVPAAFCGALAYLFEKTLLTLFVIFFPPALVIASLIAFVLR